MIKIKHLTKGFLTLFFIFLWNLARTQNYTESTLHQKLDSLALKSEGLKNSVQLNLLDLPLSEFIYSIGVENKLNITVDPSLTETISYNFYDASVTDVLLFIYLNFNVEYEFIGSIISVKKRENNKVTLSPVVVSRPIDLTYNSSNEFLSVNLEQDTLSTVMELVTKLTDKNIVIAPEIRSRLINGYFQNRPVEQVLDMLMKANGLSIIKEKEGYYTINTNLVNEDRRGQQTRYNTSSEEFSQSGLFLLSLNANGKLDISAFGIDLLEVVKKAATLTGTHYILQGTLEGKTTIDAKNLSISELFNHLFRGTKYNFNLTDEKVFLIGETKTEGLRKTELIRMENRTVENVLSAIPRELINDITLTEFVQLNGLIVTGNERSINELKRFLSSIDVVVPMIQIDVMFIFSRNQNTVKTGVKAGLKDVPTKTDGTLYPGIDVNLGANSINALLDALNGFGILNLGQVTENFYLSLSALETNNVISIESTPKIATLNGNEAAITIGETTYYQETQVNVQTSVTQQGVLQSRIWKDISADLSVRIKPFVSADEQITMAIAVSQNDFSGKTDASAPPNMTKQTFQSMVRVKNGEVILLGGLEKKTKNDSGSGVPLLSRIPVLKWLFSGREKIADKSKLHILVRSTVTY